MTQNPSRPRRALLSTLQTSVLLLAAPAAANDAPSLTLSNELIDAVVFLPDLKNGYYRGTRFDWAGVIHSLKYNGHEYFGEWMEFDEPDLHDRITGPVDEFRISLGYDEAPAGGRFIRIGVGVTEKPEEPGFNWMRTYRIVDPGKRTTRAGKNWVEFTHELEEPDSGYAYHYTKRLTLPDGRPELIIESTLRNTGDRDIVTEVYNHNFFVMDNQPIGPGFVVRFPFELEADNDLGGFAELRGNELVYVREIPEREGIFTILTGYGASPEDNRFAIENRRTGAGVRMTADKPIAKLLFWSPNTTLCPEPYMDLEIARGESKRWTLRYEFYTIDRS